MKARPSASFLARLKEHFDLIVVDSPPMGAVIDSLLIADDRRGHLRLPLQQSLPGNTWKLYIRALHNGKNDILGMYLNGLSTGRVSSLLELPLLPELTKNTTAHRAGDDPFLLASCQFFTQSPCSSHSAWGCSACSPADFDQVSDSSLGCRGD
ncbi:MAG: hypothetical protein QM760_08915 [Nibricoccus sp.]